MLLTKTQARQEARQRLAQLSSAERLEASERLCQALLAHPAAATGWVMAYAPMAHEPMLQAALEVLAQRGQLLLPRMVGTGLEACAVAPREQLRTGRFGIAEPLGDAVALEQIDLIVVPALALNLNGQRLGQGRGFYDRLLAQPGRRAWSLALAFRCQLLDAWELEEHDHKVDEVVVA